MTYAAPHAGKTVVVRFDLAYFFASVHAPRVHALVRSIGYPQEVARTLTALCTNRVPGARLLAPDVRGTMEWLEKQRCRTRHLLQGACTPPALTLANLRAFRPDLRLAGLARALGLPIRGTRMSWLSPVMRIPRGSSSGFRFVLRP